MLPSFARQTVTRLRATYIEQRGTSVRDWSNPDRLEIAGCSLQGSTGSTTWNDDRHPSAADATLYAPPGADIADADRIEYRGTVYAVDGIPVEWESPTGAVDHVEARLVTWRG